MYVNIEASFLFLVLTKQVLGQNMFSHFLCFNFLFKSNHDIVWTRVTSAE